MWLRTGPAAAPVRCTVEDLHSGLSALRTEVHPFSSCGSNKWPDSAMAS